jgi:hypothetical protein
MSLLTKLFQFVMMMVSRYNIDSSHGLSHSMNILHFTKNIYDMEVMRNENIRRYERVIYVSAIIHDMCDKKYMDEGEGIREIENFLKEKIFDWEICSIKNIISTMSYSKVKSQGFPDLGELQPAYNIVREADLLSAYDFDRCMSYRLTKTPTATVEDTYKEACELFENRVFKHESDGLLFTQYAKNHHEHLKFGSLQQMSRWRSIIHNPKFSMM